ncbi:DUF362 domain-containing protein [Heliomicrobium modesticaldum]|uniref:DUF362 domain-containing protein n=1 Tax=Heliomicrobium modesticaldum TaxID=35701 RepID=UPI0002EADD9E|nr:DUF362 domain-containing protein [Heliomicrobium modesticaldum]
MTEKGKAVAITACRSYEPGEIEAAVGRLLERLGGLAVTIRPGMRVALKPNLVMGKDPAAAVTTHPALVEAVAKTVIALGATPFIVDSPGGPSANAAGLRMVYKKTGMAAVAERLGIEVSYDTAEVEVPLTERSPLRKVSILKVLYEADAIINLPKIKTHAQTGYTGAVKNLYGAIPGMRKAEYHFRVQERKPFGELLVELNLALRPVLTVMDGVIGMEGDGPTAGEPKPFGYLLAARCPFTLDHYALSLIAVKDIEMDRVAQARGLVGPLLLLDDGETIEPVPFRPASHRRVNFVENHLPPFLARPISRSLRPLPAFDRDKCIGCRICLQSCPADALRMERIPQLDKDKCIGCLCCQEMCPERAVEVRQTGLSRLLFGSRR